MKIIDTYLEYLASLSIEQLKNAYIKYEISWIYIAEMKQRGYISEIEMNYIVRY